MRKLKTRAQPVVWPALFLLGWGVSFCAGEPGIRVPEMIGGKAVFSKHCNAIVYSSNKLNTYRPFTLVFSEDGTPSVTASQIDVEQDFLARSISHDCAWVALVADVDGKGVFDVYLYHRMQQKLTNLTNTPGQDDGDPSFSPTDPILAYLTEQDLQLYDYARETILATPGSLAGFESLRWSPTGEFLLLEASNKSIWRYDLLSSRFQELWKAEKPVFVRPSPWTDGENLYFVSDHESDFSQIFHMSLEGGEVRRVFAQENDQFSPRLSSSGDLCFRVNLDGSYRAVVVKTREPILLSPPAGVVYDYALDFDPPVFLYAGDGYPRSLYRRDTLDQDRLENLISNDFPVTQSVAELVRNKDGMNNLLYRPVGKPRGHVLWLHGGPHEEVSPRFNVYIDFLVKRGFVVLALNYPGSTGLGNKYELRGRGPKAQLRRQIAAVVRDVREFKENEGEIERFIVIGVSYGSNLAHLFAWNESSQVQKIVDFSGVAGRHVLGRLTPAARTQLPRTLFIFGSNDYALRDGRRKELLRVYEKSAEVTRLEIPRAGHYIQRRDHMGAILKALDRFLAAE